MKIKCFSMVLSSCILCAFSMVSLAAGNPDSATVALPKPQMDKGKPLMQVLKERKSTREFSPRKISDQDLSNMLWAVFGVSLAETGERRRRRP